jgi:hypothetical protein
MSSFDVSLPWPTRIANRWGHWGAQLLVGAILATIALVLKPLPTGSPLAVILPIALFLLVVVSWLLMRKHDRRLCERCMSSMPLNASEVASRYRRRFAVAHLGSNMRVAIAYLVVLLGSNVFLFRSDLLPRTLGAYVWAAVQSTMIFLVLSYSTHRKLQPWCPQCSGGDGDDESVDAPDPMPSGSERV